MSTDGVVVVLDPVAGAVQEVLEGGPGSAVDEFLLVGREEGLRDGVVVAGPGAAEGSSDIVLPAVMVEGF